MELLIHFLTVSCPSTTVALLFLIISLTRVQAELFLVASRPEHEGSVAIVGRNKTCRTLGEAALNCEMADDCRGIWFHQIGTEKYCQTARCPSSPSTVNPLPGQAGFFFLFIGVFGTGNYVVYICWLVLNILIC